MSSELDNQIKDAYEAFWAKRRAVKQQQQIELEERTAAERQDLAKVLWSARRSTESYTVQDIADLLGLSNRNFLYQVLNDKPLNDPDSAKKPVGRPSSADKKTDKVKSAPFHLVVNSPVFVDGQVYLSVRNFAADEAWRGYTLDLDESGKIVDIPEEWFVDTLTPDEVQFYKDLIQRIESGE